MTEGLRMTVGMRAAGRSPPFKEEMPGSAKGAAEYKHKTKYI